MLKVAQKSQWPHLCGERVSEQKIAGLSRKFGASKLNQKCVTELNQNLDAFVFFVAR